jgi:hypothetical protein
MSGAQTMTRRALLSAFALISCSGRKPAAVAIPQAVLPAVIPAGTQISLRTVDRIDAAGPPLAGYAAVLTSEIPKIAVPGSPARIAVTGNSLGMSALMINGTWHAVGVAGQPASLGTLIRGVLAYPYPEGNTAIVTEGSRIRVPAGSILIFRLDTPAPVSAAFQAAASGS